MNNARLRSRITDQHLNIDVIGEFTFEAVANFREAYEMDEPYNSVSVDLTKVSQIDSSVLGMLIALAKHCKANNLRDRVTLRVTDGHVQRVLDIVGFEKMFHIDSQRSMTDTGNGPQWQPTQA